MTRFRLRTWFGLGTLVVVGVSVAVLSVCGVPFLPHGWKTSEDWATDHKCFTLRILRLAAQEPSEPAGVANSEAPRWFPSRTDLPFDGWGTELAVEQSPGGDAFRSAGPDQRFGTPDDLVWPSESAKRYLAESCDSPWVAEE